MKYLAGVLAAALLVVWGYGVERLYERNRPAPPRVVVTVSPSPLPEPTCWETIIRYADWGQTERTEICE